MPASRGKETIKCFILFSRTLHRTSAAPLRAHDDAASREFPSYAGPRFSSFSFFLSLSFQSSSFPSLLCSFLVSLPSRNPSLRREAHSPAVGFRRGLSLPGLLEVPFFLSGCVPTGERPRLAADPPA